MKLLTKSTIYLIITSFVVFLISGVTVYFLMQGIISEEVDEKLADKKWEFNWELKDVKGFNNFVLPKDSTIEISPILKGKDLSVPLYGDTLIYNFLEDELLPHRYIRFSASYKNETRHVTIYRSLIETDDLIEGIIVSLLIVFLIMIVAISLLNAFGMSHVWKPFKNILEQIKIFDFRKNKEFTHVTTNIAEFVELNNELTKMTSKLTQDYLSLKEFSENASHEMQTPLAIIQSKLELLFQKEGIGDENLKAVNSAYQAANRLSRLHHELNLLTRIENHEYKDLEEIDLKTHIENHIENFSDILEIKNIELTTSLESSYKLNANAYLLEILISNLFNNAIKHNLAKDGKINIELKNNIFTISNTGNEPDQAPVKLFERFKKGKPGADSTGLGLALAKQICAFNNFKISYTYHNKLHILTVEM